MGALRGKQYCAVGTNGNGACALHGVFGRPQESSHKELFASDARAKLVGTFGDSVMQFRERVHDDMLYEAVCLLCGEVFCIRYFYENVKQYVVRKVTALERFYGIGCRKTEMYVRGFWYSSNQKNQETVASSYNVKAQQCLNIFA